MVPWMDNTGTSTTAPACTFTSLIQAFKSHTTNSRQEQALEQSLGQTSLTWQRTSIQGIFLAIHVAGTVLENAPFPARVAALAAPSHVACLIALGMALIAQALQQES